MYKNVLSEGTVVPLIAKVLIESSKQFEHIFIAYDRHWLRAVNQSLNCCATAFIFMLMSLANGVELDWFKMAGIQFQRIIG